MQFYLKIDLPSYGRDSSGGSPFPPTELNYWIDDSSNYIIDDITNHIKFEVITPLIGLYWVDDASNQLIDESGNEIYFLDTPSESTFQDEAGNILIDDAGNTVISAN